MSKRSVLGPDRAEMLLAEMIAEASYRGLRSCRAALFIDKHGFSCERHQAVACCALGALALLGKRRQDTIRNKIWYSAVISGNDQPTWSRQRSDSAESLGWAFREAMRAS